MCSEVGRPPSPECLTCKLCIHGISSPGTSQCLFAGGRGEAGARLGHCSSTSCLLGNSVPEGRGFWSGASPRLIGFLCSHPVLSGPLPAASLRGGTLGHTLRPHQLAVDSGRGADDAGMWPWVLLGSKPSAFEMDLVTPGSEDRKPATAIFARHLYLPPVSPEGDHRFLDSFSSTLGFTGPPSRSYLLPLP